MTQKLSAPEQQRIISIDIIRGFAIMGIFLINIGSFLIVDEQIQMRSISEIDTQIYRIIDMLAYKKFHFIFAFLFGVGSIIFLSKLDSSGQSIWIYIRRMIFLFLAGLGHAMIGGDKIDVLASYAIMGLFLPLFYRLPLRWIIFGILLSLIYDFCYVFTEASRFYSWDILNIPIQLDKILNPKVLCHMLLGFVAYRIGFFKNKDNVSIVRNSFICLLALSIAIWGWSLTINDEKLLHAVTFHLSIIPGMMYILGLILILRTNWAMKFLVPFQSYGRMAFTNYIMQTIIGVTIVKTIASTYVVGGLETLLICVTVYITQIVFSNLWLKKFRFGPIEWLWRCGTYMRIYSNKK